MYKLLKSSRLLTRRDYARASKGQRRSGKWLLVQVNRPASTLKIGITVSRKFGKAHERNRFKRLVREAFRVLLPSFSQNFEIVVRPKGKHPLASKPLLMQDILDDLKGILHDFLPESLKS